MPHEIVIEGERLALRDVIDVGRAAGAPLLRVHRLASGDALLVAAGDARRDGAPLIGGLAIVGWGEGALLRVAGLRVEIAWRSSGGRRAASDHERCRLCFGAFGDEEPVVVCGCEVPFHDECDRARLNCPACGAVREGDA